MTPPDDVSTRLDSIRERVEAATEGPWDSPESINAPLFTDEDPYHPVKAGKFNVARVREHIGDKGADNARFIASARSDVPYLLSLVEEVVDLLDGWERAYPTDIFPEPPERPERARLVWVDPNTGEQLSETFALGRVSAAMGRFMAAALRRALRDAAQEGAE